MKILAIGDVTSPGGLEHLKNHLWAVRRRFAVDLCVVNGENASVISGITPEGADTLFRAGADVITGGNHTLRGRGVLPALDDMENLLRPLNLPDEVPGRGYTVLPAGGCRVLVMNALGQAMMEPVPDNPYARIDRILREQAGRYDIAVMDIHAEATGEKAALAYAYDGVIQVVFGTHTHVPTADTIILPQGTGYVSDLGMCGETGGVLGMDPAEVIRRMRTRLPGKFVPAHGPAMADGVLFTVDTAIRRCTAVERVRF